MKTLRPNWLTPIPDNIPNELKKKKSWLVWRGEYHDRWTKVPYSGVVGGLKAKSNDPTTWCEFSEAVEMLRTHPGYDGIGIAMCDDLVGVDLDHCRNKETEVVEKWAIEVIEKFSSYTEFSPSGTGIRIFVRGIPVGSRVKNGNVELYHKHSFHFLTVTGHRITQFGKQVVTKIPC
jgi:putative DNA primase/helicase